MLVSKTLRKKEGFYIKKLNIFLILIASIFIKNLIINVQAENASFYEAEYIDNIYMNKYQYSTNTIYYQKARFFRKTNTNEFAYCIEPFNFFNDNSSYESTITPRDFTKEQLDRISKIAHFGYGYTNHTDIKWYAITQMMIWQVSDTTGDYYFTDSLNGNRINPYSNEINEINNLINNYSKLPSFNNNEYTIIENSTLTLEDTNNVINSFTTNLKLENNKLVINNLKEGKYTFTYEKKDNYYNKPYIFYQSSNSQNLITTGDLESIKGKIQVNSIRTEIIINKVDKDTQSIIPKGEASLDGSIFTIYNSNNQKIKDLEIVNNEAIIKNLSFGKYYIKETKSGTGYLLDNKVYEINITKDQSKHNLIVENKVIDKKITIIKKFGEESTLIGEKDISFEIYNNKHERLTTIKTNSDGIASITLPYGTYEFIQVNTTDGYKKIEPFKITIEDKENETIELKDLKIPVPNTHTNNYLLELLILLILPWSRSY